MVLEDVAVKSPEDETEVCHCRIIGELQREKKKWEDILEKLRPDYGENRCLMVHLNVKP